MRGVADNEARRLLLRRSRLLFLARRVGKSCYLEQKLFLLPLNEDTSLPKGTEVDALSWVVPITSTEISGPRTCAAMGQDARGCATPGDLRPTCLGAIFSSCRSQSGRSSQEASRSGLAAGKYMVHVFEFHDSAPCNAQRAELAPQYSNLKLCGLDHVLGVGKANSKA